MKTDDFAHSTGRTAVTETGNPPLPGRRERGKLDKRQRIFDAAATLFDDKGYAAVTTSAIAQVADIGAGTLFRYACTKSELLLMVMNERMRVGLDRGRRAAAEATDPVDAITLLLTPLVDADLGRPENIAAYQREVLFGEPRGPHRAEALQLIADLETAIATVLRTLADAGRIRPGVDLGLAARAMFSSLHMEIIRLGLGADDSAQAAVSIRAHVDVLLHGILRTE